MSNAHVHPAFAAALGTVAPSDTPRTDAEALARIAMKWCPEAPLRCVSAIEEAIAMLAERAK